MRTDLIAPNAVQSEFQQEKGLVTHERILVVDDSQQVRDVLAHLILPTAGYDALTAKSGAEALLLAQELNPDLIITDYQMPGMTGLDLIVELRKNGLQIPVILITAEGSEALAIQALRAGVSDYLHKPFRTEEILDSVKNVLTQYWQTQIRERLPAHLLEANRKLEKRVREMSTLVNIGKSVSSMLDVQDVLNEVVEAAVQVTGGEESSLLLLDIPTGELYMRAARNVDHKTLHTLRLHVQDSLAGQVIQTGEPIVVSDEEMIKIKTSYLVKSVVYVPLRVKQQIVGVLSVDNRFSARHFDFHDVQILSILADFAAVALENARLYAETIQERNTLDAILRDTEDHVVVVDSEDRVLFCNPTARRTFNVTMADFLGRPLSEVIDNPEVLALFSKQALVGRGRRSEITLNSGERVLQAQLTIIDNVGRSAVMQDITHLKQLDKIKGEFVTTVSHDLRSPLTAILAYVELLQRMGPLNEQQQKFAHNISINVNNISKLISELLELGKIEAGFDVDFESVDLRTIASDVISSVSHEVDTKQHTLDIELDGALPNVLGNPLRLRQVIANLLGNAIKYTPENGHVRIALYPDDSMVVLQVSDSGIGIPNEDQPYVFDKFFRSQSAIENFEGTGLGLSIVKSIIEQHNGRIWLESKENQGTTFTVVLPNVNASSTDQGHVEDILSHPR